MPRTRRRSVLVLAIATAVGASVLAATPAHAAAVTVSPNSDLHNADVVTVTATGLEPNSSYDIAECQLAIAKANPGNPAPGCDPDATGVFSNASGRLSTSLNIHTGQIGTDSGSVCDASTNGTCGVDIALHGWGPLSGTAKIGFAGGTVDPKVTESASKTKVRSGKPFNIGGRVLGAGHGVNGLKLTVYKRKNSHASWAKAAATKTKSAKGKAGSYDFRLKGLKHSEQYQVRHKTQHLAGTTYEAAKGKTIRIRP
jgi:hypothetical protein